MSTAGKAKPRWAGCHVSCAGGLHNALVNAEKLGVNTIQIHASPPQQWNRKPFPKGVESKYMEHLKNSGVGKVFFHAIYLINLATPDAERFKLAQLSLTHCLELLARIGGDGLVVHVGSMKDQPDEERGYDRAAEGINKILAKSPSEARLILEVAAGSGKIIGSRMEELAAIYSRVKEQERVGFGLDTQHLWASGYDLKTDLEGVVKQCRKHFGLRKIWLIHLNDSKTELGSKRDRHENIGDGLIGRKALKDFINHRSFRKIPVVLETPDLRTIDTAHGEVKKLWRML